MEKRIWDFLTSNGFNAYAAAGIMGNLFAESGLIPTNVEDSSGQADASYTQKVDDGSYLNFVNDRIGYGIAQWTAPDRKKNFYDFMKSNGLSIGDLDGQLNFLLLELKTSFNSVYKELLQAKTVADASNVVLIKYENPADKSDAVKRKRTTYGFKYYNKYSKTAVDTTTQAQTTIVPSNTILKQGSVGPEVKELQENLTKLGYNCGTPDGDFGVNTLSAVIQFQQENNLEPDGEAGPLTKAKIIEALNNNYTRPATNVAEYTAEQLIAIATAEIGYKEKRSNANLDDKTANAGANNFTKYARDLASFGYYNGSKQGFAWCDVFVDWCFLKMCGGNPTIAQNLQCQTGPFGAGCAYSAQYYKQQNRWSSTPVLGAQIFFYASGTINHTGIVSAVNGDTVTTIEGNTSEQVVTRTYNINNKSIAGYGLPKYTEKKKEEQNIFTPYKVKITAKKLNIRQKPDMNSAVINIATQGQIKEIVAEENSFGKLGNEDGWIMLAYTKL